MKKFLLFALLVLIGVGSSYAQVTTGSITGSVTDSKGETLIGATVKATHVPTGTVYGVTTNTKGQYTLANVRIGGPYTVVVTYVGFNTATYQNMEVTLGNPLKVNVVLRDDSKTLSEVVISGQKHGVISSERNGTSTNISQGELQALPTISRNIQDYVRLNPQTATFNNSNTGAPSGMSIGGMHQKFNKFSVDGAAANDVFGLTATGTNGGQAAANPIPLDAIQEMQVVVSPYDVTMVGFAGGGINAVTKSGTNTLHGTAYTYLQNQDLIGKNPFTDLKYADFTKTIYGASLGGAIVKNKLFFFGNFERNIIKTPNGFNPEEAGSGSNFNVTELERLRAGTLAKYSYDPGAYGNQVRETPSTTVFARIDWNINDKHKLTFRHNYVDASDRNLGRSAATMNFGNAGYSFNSRTNSSVIELNSTFNSRFSNVLRASYNNIKDYRTTADFPSVYVRDQSSGVTLNYNLGADYSSAKNRLTQNNFNFTDNLTFYNGDHTITVGTSNDFYSTNNVFMQNAYGYYTYNSIDDFLNNTSAPAQYQVGFSTKGKGDDAAAKIQAAQFRVYAQDVWQVSPKFRLTYGAGFELPMFFNTPDNNVTFNSSQLALNNDVATNRTPRNRWYFTPRIGFNWDVNGDASTQIRGGAGVFTGPTPLVWLSNQYTNTGVASIKYTASGSELAGIRFNYDPNDGAFGAYIPANPATAATEINVTDKDFKLPRMFRSNLAIDQKLPWGLVGTIEGLYNKTMNTVKFMNINLAAPTGEVTLGSTRRPFYGKRIDNRFTDVIYMTNTNAGYSYNLTAQIQKQMTKDGWAGSIAYSYGDANSLSDATSSTAYSNWRYTYTINGLNNVEADRSNYSTGSRVIGYVSKTFRYLNDKMATTVGLVYQGQSGQTYSYIYNRNILGDDITNYNGNAILAYIPNSLADAQFVNISNGLTAQQQWDEFVKFAEANPYLKETMGSNVKRNAARTPWENHFDLRVAQDFKVYKTHKLQVSFDIQNVGALLSSKWGRAYYISNQSVNLFTAVARSASQTPTFQFNPTQFQEIDGVRRPWTQSDYGSRWRGQLSFRYSF